MATQTTYYEFNKPAGTDLVNPLVDTNPNWDIADISLHELNTRSFANCTEVVSLGVHAISRLNTYTKFLKWIATANFTAGDTFTVDGNVVAAATPSGEALATGAYVTGAIVIACLNADDSAMTIFVTGTNVATDSAKLGGELPSYYAKQSDMTSAQTDIGNIQALDGNTSIADIGDGTLTGGLAAVKSALPNLNGCIKWDKLYDKDVDTAGSFRKGISNFDYLLILAYCNSQRQSCIIPAIIGAKANMISFAPNTLGTQTTAQLMTYAAFMNLIPQTDTTFTVDHASNNGSYGYLVMEIYGIKIVN